MTYLISQQGFVSAPCKPTTRCLLTSGLVAYMIPAMSARRIVLDTNVLVSGLRSSRGASFRLLRLVGVSPKFEINVSVPLVLQYEEVLKRQARVLGLTYADVDAVVNYLCAVANRREVFFLWRPFLRDPDDDLVLEVAVESEATEIVTFNLRDFAGTDRFGIEAITPRDFLERIGELP